MNKPPLELLKDLSAIVVGVAAVLYVFGFTVHHAYFRLLGIDMVGQPLDYMRLAADYCASIVGAMSQLPFRIGYYLPKLFQGVMLLATVTCLLITLILLLLHLPIPRLKDYLTSRMLFGKRLTLRLALWHVLNVLLVICWFAILYTELNITKVRDVLQPVDAADIQQMQGQPTNTGTDWQNEASLELRSKNVARVYSKYVQTQKDAPGFHDWNNWFNPVERPHTGEERIATYMALVLVNLISLIAITHQFIFIKRTPGALTSPPDGSGGGELGQWVSRLVTVVLSLVLSSQLLLFPFVYATLGRYFTYPIVALKIEREETKEAKDPRGDTGASTETKNSDTPATPSMPGLLDPSWTHGVYLIAQTDSEVVVYDRLNFFQIKRVPRGRVLAINQLFNASPFDSCSKEEDEFQPCEVLWMPVAKPILDF